jgi:hypothetical protein
MPSFSILISENLLNNPEIRGVTMEWVENDLQLASLGGAPSALKLVAQREGA